MCVNVYVRNTDSNGGVLAGTDEVGRIHTPAYDLNMVPEERLYKLVVLGFFKLSESQVYTVIQLLRPDNSLCGQAVECFQQSNEMGLLVKCIKRDRLSAVEIGL